jgi:hypothetical protein
MNRERVQFDAAQFEVFLTWLASVVELFANCLASVARDV